MKLLQDEEEEPNNVQRRIHQLIEVQQKRESVLVKSQEHQERMKNIFDKRDKERNFDYWRSGFKMGCKKRGQRKAWKV
jgi:hypothetical protein